jgi:hypothetical protein
MEKKQLPHIVTIILLFLCTHVNAQLSINEFQASNTKTLAYNFLYPDWIELKNSGSSAVNLSGYYLSDTKSDRYKWSFPSGTTIPANGYLIVYANGNNSGLQTNFSLSASGDDIYLSSNLKVALDSVSFDFQYQDLAYGRKSDGTWAFFKVATPNAANNDASAFYSYTGSPVFSLPSGVYNTTQTVALSAEPGAKIYYTTNGSVPTTASNMYTSPITISSTTVIKAIASTTNGNSLVAGSSYVFGASHTLPVIMLTSSNDRAEWVTKKVAKKNVDGRVHVEYFDQNKQKVIDQYAMFRASGATSKNKPQLNGKITPAFEKESFKYNFFNNKKVLENKGFLLRNSSQDNGIAHMRDAVYSKIIGDDDITDGFLYEAYGAAVLYVDGVYDGVIHVMEDNDKYFLENNFPDMNATQVQSQYNFSLGTDKLNYNNAADRTTQQDKVNIHDVLTTYFLINIGLPSGDSPLPMIVTLPGKKPANRTYIHDLDWSMGLGNPPYAAYNPSLYQPWSTGSSMRNAIPANILAYEPYKAEAAQFSAAMINFVVDSSRILSIIDQIRDSYKGEMTAMANTLKNTCTMDPPAFGKPFLPYYNNESEWLKHVDTLKRYAKKSYEGSMDFIKTKFGYTTQIEMTFQTSGAAHGNIRVHGIKVLGASRKGNFFNTIPLNLEAVPNPGYAFSHWEGAVTGTSSKVTSTFASNATVKAVFVPIGFTAHKVHINELQSVNDSTVVDEFGEFNDWIEIYNKEAYAVNLAGYYVSDDIRDLRKWRIKSTDASKTTVNAGSWLMLWADKDTLQGPNHLNFKFDNSEQFILTYPDGVTIADSLTFKLASNESLGSLSDGSAAYVKFSAPTPNKSNNILTGLEGNDDDVFTIYPNPTLSGFTINAQSAIKNVDIEIHSIDGKMVKKLNQNPISSYVNISNLERGIYLVIIKSGDTSTVKKVIKL